jgi:hypothetical protein
MTKVKKALLRYAQTEDSEYILHPEHLVTAMPFLEAKAENHRNADRHVLLGD